MRIASVSSPPLRPFPPMNLTSSRVPALKKKKSFTNPSTAAPDSRKCIKPDVTDNIFSCHYHTVLIIAISVSVEQGSFELHTDKLVFVRVRSGLWRLEMLKKSSQMLFSLVNLHYVGEFRGKTLLRDML